MSFGVLTVIFITPPRPISNIKFMRSLDFPQFKFDIFKTTLLPRQLNILIQEPTKNPTNIKQTPEAPSPPTKKKNTRKISIFIQEGATFSPKSSKPFHSKPKIICKYFYGLCLSTPVFLPFESEKLIYHVNL